MKRKRSYCQILLYAFFIFFFSVTPVISQQSQFHLPFLEQQYEQTRYCKIPLRKLRHTHVDSLLHDLKAKFPQTFGFEKIGQSVEKRPIYLVKLGNGKTKVLLWSQMHGDEPTATGALFDIFYYLMKNRKETFVRNILSEITILAVPMLNPDGAEKYQRRNAQGLDINRDARNLQSPEGKILYNLRKKYQPDFGFNLHDQRSRRTVGKTNKLVAIALMAPPYDFELNDNSVRIQAKKIVSVIHQSLGPYIYGHIAKYDAGYMPRAFGDAMQRWGVSTVLIESGGWFQHRGTFLQKMNFIALMTVFHALANGNYQDANPAVYDALAQNDKEIFDLIISDVTVLDGTGSPPFRTDVAINYKVKDKSKYPSESVGFIEDMGDLNFFAAKDTINGERYWLTPGLVAVSDKLPSSSSEVAANLQKLLQWGYTSILIPFSPGKFDQIAALRSEHNIENTPCNVGGICSISHEKAGEKDIMDFVKILSSGSIGVLKIDQFAKLDTLSKWLNKPVYNRNELPQTIRLRHLSPERIKEYTSDQAKRWKLPKRGKIRIGQVADLVLFTQDDNGDYNVKWIFIKGYPVWKNGSRTKSDVIGERWLPRNP